MPKVRFVQVKKPADATHGRGLPYTIWLDTEDGKTQPIGQMFKEHSRLWIAKYTHPVFGVCRIGARHVLTLKKSIREAITWDY